MPNRKKISKDLIKSICALIEEGGHTIAEMCSLSGISERSFYNWKKESAENTVFIRAIENAKEKYQEKMIVEARKSLRKVIQGFDEVVVTKSKTRNLKNGTQQITWITQTKCTPPDLGAIILVLNNKDPKGFNKAFYGYCRRKKK